MGIVLFLLALFLFAAFTAVTLTRDETLALALGRDEDAAWRGRSASAHPRARQPSVRSNGRDGKRR